jgi:hypothetical protein
MEKDEGLSRARRWPGRAAAEAEVVAPGRLDLGPNIPF